MEHLDFSSVEQETQTFIKNARAQYYIAPNRVIPKKDRSNWRFTAKRLVEQITALANQPDHQQASASLLEDMYKLLCYASGRYVFTSEEPFYTIKIPQEAFLERVILLKKKMDAPSKWIEESLVLILEEGIDRYTLYSALLETLLETLDNAPLREEAVRIADNLLQEKRIIQSKTVKTFYNSEAIRNERFINNLVEMLFMTQSSLGEYEKAIELFKKYYQRSREEVALYVLLQWISGDQRVEEWVREYKLAVKQGIEPRDSLQRTYEYIKRENKLPEFIF